MDAILRTLMVCPSLRVFNADDGLNASISEEDRDLLLASTSREGLQVSSLDRGTAMVGDGQRFVMVSTRDRLQDVSRAFALCWVIAHASGKDIVDLSDRMARATALLVHTGQFAAPVQNYDALSSALAPLLAQHAAHLLLPVEKLDSDRAEQIVREYGYLLETADS